MARRLSGRPERLADPEELSHFSTHGIAVRNAARTTGDGYQPYVELFQRAQRPSGEHRDQHFVIAFDRLAAIARAAKTIHAQELKQEQPVRTAETERKGRFVEIRRVETISRYAEHGIDVRVAVRATEKGNQTFVRLTQTTKHYDRSERTQQFHLSLDALSQVVESSRAVQPTQWYALAHLDQKLESAAIVRVVKAFKSRTDAELAAHGTSLIVIPQPFLERPERDQPYLLSQGESVKLDRQVKASRWREETDGAFHALGVWFDRGTEPNLNDRVRVEVFHEYRGEHRERRVTPRYGALEPGPADEPLHIVFRKPDHAAGSPTIAAICQDENEAKSRIKELDESVRARRTASDNTLWEKVELPPELRAHTPGTLVRTFTRGQTNASVFERIDENGKKQSTVLLTRPQRQPDGTTREVTTTHSLAEFRALAKEVLGRGQGRGETQARVPEARHEPRERRGTPRTPEPQKTSTHVDPKYYILTVWQAQELPRKGTMVRFPLGESQLENRPSFPAVGTWTPRNDEKPVYLLVKRVLEKQGVGVVEDFIKPLDLALKRADVCEAREVGKRNYQQRIETERQQRQQQRQQERGFTPGF